MTNRPTDLVWVTPNTDRLSQLCHEHGHTWRRLGGPKKMQCFNGEVGIHLQTPDKSHNCNVLFDIVEYME